MSVLNSSTSVQMVSWRPCRQTLVATAVLSPSRPWTTCRIPARTRIVPQLHSSSSLRRPLGAHNYLSGVRSDPATTTTVFASRAPASISWTRLLDVLSRNGETVVRRRMQPTLTDYKWNLDCLHLLHPPRLRPWRHTSRPSVAWRSRLPSSTPTLSLNEGEGRNAGILGETRQKCIYLTDLFPVPGGGWLSLWNIEHMTVTCWSCVAAVTTTQSRCERPAAPLFVPTDRRSIVILLFLFIKIETLDCNSPTSVQHEPNQVLYMFCGNCAERTLCPSPTTPLFSEDWTLAKVNDDGPLCPAFWPHPLKSSLICRLKHTCATNVCLNLADVNVWSSGSAPLVQNNCRTFWTNHELSKLNSTSIHFLSAAKACDCFVE